MDSEYFDKFSAILDTYVPDRGEGESMASQIATAVNKLIYKWFNDGDVYDNTAQLQGWANDLSSYANWLYKYVTPTQDILDEVYDDRNDDEYEDTLKSLADLTLDEEFLSKYTESPATGSIYDCDGPFEFVEDNYDDDDEEDY